MEWLHDFNYKTALRAVRSKIILLSICIAKYKMQNKITFYIKLHYINTLQNKIRNLNS